MQRSPDVEAQAPEAGQCHISDCFILDATLCSAYYISQFGILNDETRVQIPGTVAKIESMKRISSVRFKFV